MTFLDISMCQLQKIFWLLVLEKFQISNLQKTLIFETYIRNRPLNAWDQYFENFWPNPCPAPLMSDKDPCPGKCPECFSDFFRQWQNLLIPENYLDKDMMKRLNKSENFVEKSRKSWLAGIYEYFRIENKVTTRREGPQSLSYHTYSLNENGLLFTDSLLIQFV